jgi:hypothetical protein
MPLPSDPMSGKMDGMDDSFDMSFPLNFWAPSQLLLKPIIIAYHSKVVVH